MSDGGDPTVRPLRVAFLGSPDFAVPTLHALISAGHDVACVYAQPPRPAGRGKRDRPTAVHSAAEAVGLEVRTPRTLRDPDAQAAFGALNLDAAVVVAYGLILPPAILTAPRLGCVNVHASLLPRWRGAAPIQRAILAGDGETGVTIMQMDEGLDTGAMLLRRSVPIGSETTASQLHDVLSALGAEAIVPALAGLDSGTLTPVRQPDEGVTYAKKLERDEGRLDFARPAADLERQVRAFDPWPGAFFDLGGERFKVLSAQVLTIGALANAPGTVLDHELTIACGVDALRPTRIQRAGKAPMPTEALLRGFPVAPGVTVG